MSSLMKKKGTSHGRRLSIIGASLLQTETRERQYSKLKQEKNTIPSSAAATWRLGTKLGKIRVGQLPILCDEQAITNTLNLYFGTDSKVYGHRLSR